MVLTFPTFLGFSDFLNSSPISLKDNIAREKYLDSIRAFRIARCTVLLVYDAVFIWSWLRGK